MIVAVTWFVSAIFFQDNDETGFRWVDAQIVPAIAEFLNSASIKNLDHWQTVSLVSLRLRTEKRTFSVKSFMSLWLLVCFYQLQEHGNNHTNDYMETGLYSTSKFPAMIINRGTYFQVIWYMHCTLLSKSIKTMKHLTLTFFCITLKFIIHLQKDPWN